MGLPIATPFPTDRFSLPFPLASERFRDKGADEAQLQGGVVTSL